jgi:hypothetical protein
MSREIKILLIVLGSLVGIAVIGVVALVLALPHLLNSFAQSGRADPVAARRTAAKIATFEIPRGYRIETASDLGLTQVVTIVPRRGPHGSFSMQLQGTMTSSGTASVQGMKMGMGLAGHFMPCDLKDEGTDDVVVRGVRVELSVMQCTSASFPFRIESGIFPGNAAQATITAMGIRSDFDTKALHALLTSVR